jgi:hypothetical protein
MRALYCTRKVHLQHLYRRMHGSVTFSYIFALRAGCRKRRKLDVAALPHRLLTSPVGAETSPPDPSTSRPDIPSTR